MTPVTDTGDPSFLPPELELADDELAARFTKVLPRAYAAVMDAMRAES